MHIKNVIIDGFKSYGKRTEVKEFDPQFNAITGLNGTGKSNILDSICFVMGISNLSQVRATNLTELVYKSGQAGVNKATVTIQFDNRDKSQSPIGYEQYDEINITRQVVIGGKNRYLINGVNVQNNKVQDLFRSVQLNVNNPHFLIMQGRITKVLNMKPPEILGMLEEAAGTKMYEAKKIQSIKTIEKKNAKLDEINALLNETVTPLLTKLQAEKQQYMEYTKLDKDLNNLTQLYVAYMFVTAKDESEKLSKEHEKESGSRKGHEDRIRENEETLKTLESLIQELQAKKDQESGKKLEELEKAQSDKQKQEARVEGDLQDVRYKLKAEKNKLKGLEKGLQDDKGSLATKEAQKSRMESLFEELRSNEKRDAEELEKARKRFQAVSSGLYSGGDEGDAASLQQQIMDAEAKISSAETEHRMCGSRLKHAQEDLREKEGQAKRRQSGGNQDVQDLERGKKEIQALQHQLGRLSYREGQREELEARRNALSQDIRRLQHQVNSLESSFPYLNFRYKDPAPNFDRSRVKGVLAKLFQIHDPRFAEALQVTAGGKLYNVVTDTEVTSKLLIDRGQLTSRTTIIPLNKISSSRISDEKIRAAQRLVGKENVWPALSLISYDKSLHPAMQWVFGNTFICTDMSVAKRIAYDKSIRTMCVTLDGDSCNPMGTLTGGARSKGQSVLAQLYQLKNSIQELDEKVKGLEDVERQLTSIMAISERWNALKEQVELKSTEVELLEDRVKSSKSHRDQEEIDEIKAQIEEEKAKMKKLEEEKKAAQTRLKEVRSKMADIASLQEREMKAAKEHLNACQKAATLSHQKWKEKEQDADTLALEVQELEKAITLGEEMIANCHVAIQALTEQEEEAKKRLDEAKAEVKDCKQAVQEQKQRLAAATHEVQAAVRKAEKLKKENNELELQLKQQEYQIQKLASEAKAASQKVQQLLSQHQWIRDQQKFFGKPGSAFDFQAKNPIEAGKKINALQEKKSQLEKNINVDAVTLIEQTEKEYKDLLTKKAQVEKDKQKIEDFMRDLDEKKTEVLRTAHLRVNRDFGTIFSTLLPGSQARLDPPEGQNVLDGLEIKVAFGGSWKESLNELSGGQRSLVALSLILAMLLFKPAPIYILDEVDSALDLSHTQNIGRIIKSHFMHSQFIIVSLKDGMFNNANVLFRTQFVDGNSAVIRQALR